jgi:hypothetical protein
MSDSNYFAQLNAINVSDHIEKKGGFNYLSWPFAVAQLRLADPAATWEVRRFDGLPYLACDAGVFVEVAVTVQGICLSQIHPVLDSRTRPLQAPNSFDINTSIQRCLVKAIALHGLGLYIYGGEDLPQAANEPAVEPKVPHSVPVSPPTATPTAPTQIGAKITRSQQAHLHKLVLETGSDLQRLLRHFGVEALADLPAGDFVRVVRSLQQRRSA